MIDGTVHLGPNAVLAFAREGYSRRDINFSDLFETLRYPGFWRLIAKHVRTGAAEMLRAMSKSAFVKKVQHLLPKLRRMTLYPAGRASAPRQSRPMAKWLMTF